MSLEYLTLEEVLREAERLGLNISERTFRYYGVLGLLPTPQKGVNKNGDARLAYYEHSILERLQDIRQLQSQGYSLKQLKNLLTSSQVKAASLETDHPLIKAISSGAWTEMVLRWLGQRGNTSARKAACASFLTQLIRMQGGPNPTQAELDCCLSQLQSLQEQIQSQSTVALGWDCQPETWSELERIESELSKLEIQDESIRFARDLAHGQVRDLRLACQAHQPEATQILGEKVRKLYQWLETWVSLIPEPDP